MKEKLHRLSTCVAVLYAISFFLFLFFLISVHTQPVSFGFAIYALICIGVAQLLNSFVSDMRDTINEMEQTMKEYRDQLWRDIRNVKKTLDQKRAQYRDIKQRPAIRQGVAYYRFTSSGAP